MKYDIYNLLEYVNYEIKKNTANKFVVNQFYSGLRKKHPLPEGTSVGLKKTYKNSRGRLVRSTILLNTLEEVEVVRKTFFVPASILPRKVAPGSFGGPRAKGEKSLVHLTPLIRTETPQTSEPIEFIQPYPQPSLGNELGLTSSDLAKSLGTEHKHVLQKIRRISEEKLRSMGFIVEASIEARLGFSLSTDTAKFFIAKWDNDIGLGYLKYLLQCEKVAERPNLFSPEQMAQIMSMAMTMYKQSSSQEIKEITTTTIEKTVAPKIELNTERHDDAMLSSSQQSICQPLYTEQNAKHQCSIVHSLIKKAAKIRFKPDTPASDCTWHKIRQRDFEDLVDFIKNYELTELDMRRIAKFRATERGQKDQIMWQKS